METLWVNGPAVTIAFNSQVNYSLDARCLEDLSIDESVVDVLVGPLAAYHGELLPGFYDEWVMLEREYLNFVFEHNMARLLVMLQSEGRWLDVLAWGEHWLAFGQKPEPAYRALMHAHMENGDISKVADTYARCVRALGEIGLEPTEQTRELYERLKLGKIHSY